MPSVTGKSGTVAVGGSQIFSGHLREWERTIEEEGNIGTTSQGDTWASEDAPFKKWTARARYEFPKTGYASHGSLVGTAATLALEIIAGETGNFFAAGAIITSDRVTASTTEKVEGEMSFRTDGTAPTEI